MKKKRSKAITIVGSFELIKGAISSIFFLAATIGQHWDATLVRDLVLFAPPCIFILLSAIGILKLSNFARKLNIIINIICSLLVIFVTIKSGSAAGHYFGKNIIWMIALLAAFLPSVIVLTMPGVRARFISLKPRT